jgi:hypothetical protein
LQILAPPDADLATLYRAEQYLAFAGSGDGGRRYRLSPASLDRGVRLGGDPDELVAQLTRLGQQPLSPEWHDAIRAWTDARRRLRLGARLVVWSEEPDLLDESLILLGPDGERTLGVERLTERQALVGGDRIAELLTALAQAGLPVDVEPGLRAEPSRPGRAAALADGVAETAFVALEVLRRLAPEIVAEQRDLQAARSRIEAALSPAQLELLHRRAASIAAAIAERRRPGSRRRRVVS